MSVLISEGKPRSEINWSGVSLWYLVNGATVYIQSNGDGTYNFAIVNEQENIIVTAMQSKTRA